MAAAAIVVGAVVLAAFLVSLASEPEQRELPSRVPFVETAAAVAGSGAIPVRAAGTVRPSAEISVAPQVGGKVVWVNPAFRSGRRIEAGDALFRIDEADYVFRLREAEAGLAARQAAFLEAQEEAAMAKAEYQRYTDREPGAAAPALASPLALHEPQLKAAQAALQADEARVAEAELAVARARVNAPFDGFVREESVDVGQFLTVGQAVGRLFAADAVEVVVPLSDADVAMIPGLWSTDDAGETGVPARVIADYGGVRYAWQGHVDRVEASLDEQTRTIHVIVRVPDPFEAGTPLGPSGAGHGGPPLLVGKFVEVGINGLAPGAYFRVPRAALHPGDEIWAVGDNGRVRVVPVSVLQRGDDELYVTGALERGEQVVTVGLQFATDGMIVRTAGPGSR